MASSILCLPNELIEKLCFELDLKDRYSLRSVCRQLKPAVDGSFRDLKALLVEFDVWVLGQDEEETKHKRLERAVKAARFMAVAGQHPAAAIRMCRLMEEEDVSSGAASSSVSASRRPPLTGEEYSIKALVSGRFSAPGTENCHSFAGGRVRADRLVELLRWCAGGQLETLEFVTDCKPIDFVGSGPFAEVYREEMRLLLAPLSAMTSELLAGQLKRLSIFSCFLLRAPGDLLRVLHDLIDSRRQMCVQLRKLQLGLGKHCKCEMLKAKMELEASRLIREERHRRLLYLHFEEAEMHGMERLVTRAVDEPPATAAVAEFEASAGQSPFQRTISLSSSSSSSCSSPPDAGRFGSGTNTGRCGRLVREMFGRPTPNIQPSASGRGRGRGRPHRRDFSSWPGDEDMADLRYANEIMSKEAFLDLFQRLMDSCSGVQLLDVDELLKFVELRVTSVRYPCSLEELTTRRLGTGEGGEVLKLVQNCPFLRSIEVTCDRVNDADFTAIRNLGALESLVFRRLTPFQCTSANAALFEDEMYTEPPPVRFPNLRGVAFKSSRAHGTFLVHLVRCAPNLEKVFYNTPDEGDDEEDDVAPRPSAQQLQQQQQQQLIIQQQILQQHGAAVQHHLQQQQQQQQQQGVAHPQQQHHLHLLPAVTPSAILQLCELSQLRVLRLNLNTAERHCFTDAMLDRLADHCPNLEVLRVRSSSTGQLSLPRLLRRCARLRRVALPISLALGTLDSLVMIRSIAADLDERAVYCLIEVENINGGSYEAINRICEGLGASAELTLSDLSDYCLHEKEQCDRCLFYPSEAERADEAAADGEETKPPLPKFRSLVLGRKGARHLAIVFCCRPLLAV